MKTFITIILLLTITACGKGGGGGSSAPAPVPEIPVDNPTPVVEPEFTPDPNHPVIDYELVVTGCQGAMFNSLSFINYASVDENRVDWPGAIGASGTTNISQVGREILWEVENIGSCQITMKLYREDGGSTYLEEHIDILPGNSAEILY